MARSYWWVHYDRQVRLGHAETFECVGCGKQAAQWAYQGGAAIELVSPRGYRYSENDDDYKPMCRSCHSLLDMTEAKIEHLRRNVVLAFGPSWSRPGPRGSTITNAMRWRCEQCGLESTPGPLRLHQVKLNHTGVEKL